MPIKRILRKYIEFLRYAEFLVRRSLVANTLGNIAVRVRDDAYPEHGVVYTKRRGISLEEMAPSDVVVTEVITDRLLAGSMPPSNGHKMSRAIFAIRKDANAVIHTHADVVIGYFSQNAEVPFRFVSVDTALVLGAAPTILPLGVNIETDPAQVESAMLDSNCFVMPNHGLTTVGRTLSDAYNRHTAFISEVWRLLLAMMARRDEGIPLKCVNDAQTRRHYELSEQILNGSAPK